MASAALMMLTAACSNDNVEPADQTAVQFAVNLDGIESRAPGDGTTVDQLIFAVYDSEGNELTQLRQDDIDVTGRQALVTTSVARGQDYTFVFWAQKRDNGHYNTANLKDVVVSYDGPANDESRDAFTATVVKSQVNAPISETVKLYRPFAQLDYVCDIDEWENVFKSIYQLDGCELTVAGGAFTHLNLLTGKASQPTAVGDPFVMATANFVTTRTASGATVTYDDLFTGQDGNKFWISMNYLLASTEQTTLGATTLNIYPHSDSPKPIVVTSDNVPIRRNHRTVIYLSDLTKLASANISIDPGFGGDL